MSLAEQLGWEAVFTSLFRLDYTEKKVNRANRSLKFKFNVPTSNKLCLTRVSVVVDRHEGLQEADVLRQVGEEPEPELPAGEDEEEPEDGVLEQPEAEDEHEEPGRSDGEVVHALAHHGRPQGEQADGDDAYGRAFPYCLKQNFPKIAFERQSFRSSFPHAWAKLKGMTNVCFTTTFPTSQVLFLMGSY